MGVLHNEQTNFYAGACKQITDMLKQLNYVWLTAEITVTTAKHIKYLNSIHHTRYSFYHMCYGSSL